MVDPARPKMRWIHIWIGIRANKPKTQDQTVEELNANLPTLFRSMHKCNQQKNVVPIKEPQGPNEYFDEQSSVSTVIHRTNGSTENRHLNKAIVRRMNDEVFTVPTVQENIEAVNAASHFPKLKLKLKLKIYLFNSFQIQYNFKLDIQQKE